MEIGNLANYQRLRSFPFTHDLPRPQADRHDQNALEGKRKSCHLTSFQISSPVSLPFKLSLIFLANFPNFLTSARSASHQQLQYLPVQTPASSILRQELSRRLSGRAQVAHTTMGLLALLFCRCPALLEIFYLPPRHDRTTPTMPQPYHLQKQYDTSPHSPYQAKSPATRDIWSRASHFMYRQVLFSFLFHLSLCHDEPISFLKAREQSAMIIDSSII